MPFITDTSALPQAVRRLRFTAIAHWGLAATGAMLSFGFLVVGGPDLLSAFGFRILAFLAGVLFLGFTATAIIYTRSAHFATLHARAKLSEDATLTQASKRLQEPSAERPAEIVSAQGK